LDDSKKQLCFDYITMIWYCQV